MIVLVALVWLLTLAKLPVTWRNRRDPAARGYWLAILSVTLVITFYDEPVYLWLGSSLPNLGIPLATAAGVGAGFWSQFFLSRAAGAGRIGWRAWPALAMFAVVIACYPFGAGTHPNTVAMINTPPQTWGELVMGVCLAVWAGYVLTDIGRICLRFAATADHGALRLGMIVATLGCPLIGAWVVIEYGPYGIYSWRATSQAPWEHTLIATLNVVGLLGFAMVAFGLGLPAVARRFRATRDWLCDLRSYLRLGRLWHTVRPAVPTLGWPAYRLPLVHRLVFVDLRGRLYRRVVEIQDGYFALQPYRDAGYERYLVSSKTDNSDTWTARAHIDALAIVRAVPRFVDRDRPALAAAANPELLDDVRYLELVSRALRTSAGDVVPVEALQ